jgi:heme oxygenase
MISTSPNPVLLHLRNATADLHKKLDQSLPLASAHPSLEDYTQHLLGFKNWLSDIGASMDGSSLVSPELLALNATALRLLASDLQALNVQESPAPSFPDNSIRLNAGFCLGIEYVVKGSALGSAMLYRKASALFPSAPVTFMQDAMMHGKDRWKQFLVKLETHMWTEDDLSSAREGSIWAFQRYIQLHEMSLNTQ